MSAVNKEISEKEFMVLFSSFVEKLIPKSTTPSESNTIAELQNILNDNAFENKDSNSSYIKAVLEFINKLNELDFYCGLIPYNFITEVIYRDFIDDEVRDNLISILNKGGELFFAENSDDKNKKTYYKIVRHIDLAVLQKSLLYLESQQKLKILSDKYEELSEKNIQLQIQNEQLQTSNEELENKIIKLTEDASKTYNSLLSQFITILGIFAAILMGAFGSIQSFTNLFNNAGDLPLSKLLILSSIGGSAVILILFFLLDTLGKLIKRSIASTKDKSSPLIEKYPFLVVSHGFFIFIALIGSAIELSNTKLNRAWEGLWWLLPIGWLVFFLFVLHKNSIKLFRPNKIWTRHSNTENHESLPR